MSNFRHDDEWLVFEQGGLHELRHDLIQDVDVIMPRLVGPDGSSFCAAEIQKYLSKDGRELWRSLTPKRDVFRSGYESRERCAQDVVRECAGVRKRIEWRKARLARPNYDLQVDPFNRKVGCR